MGLRDLDSLKHKEQMHKKGHYESDEPISSPLWLLKGIHSFSQVAHCCNIIHLTDSGLTRTYIYDKVVCCANTLIFAFVVCITAHAEYK